MAERTDVRMPTVFICHGGGPMPLMGDPKHKDLVRHLRALPATLPGKPAAIVVVSAHWEEAPVAVQTSRNPPLLFDYHGFPPETYRYTYPAPGAPELASRLLELLRGAGVEARADPTRGYDHGTFVPLMLMYPEHDIPVCQVSLHKSLDPELHVRVGRALAGLRDDGVLVLGSGMSYHNFAFEREPSVAFDNFLNEACDGTDADTRAAALRAWARAPAARAAHPREEHLLPLMVCAGAAGAAPGRNIYRGELFGVQVSAFQFD